MKHLFALLLTISGLMAHSQQISIESGKSITSFDFNDFQTRNSILSNIQYTSKNYMSIGYGKKVAKDILSIIGGIGVNSYGAIGSDVNQNFFEWNTTYLSVYTGIDVRVITFSNMAFSIRATASPEFIVQGTQRLNNQVYNLVGAEDFDKVNLFVRGGAIYEYNLTYSLSLFFQYRYGKSTQLRNPSLDNTNGKLHFKSHDIGFGLIIKLDSKEAKEFRNRVQRDNRR